MQQEVIFPFRKFSPITTVSRWDAKKVRYLLSSFGHPVSYFFRNYSCLILVMTIHNPNPQKISAHTPWNFRDTSSQPMRNQFFRRKMNRTAAGQGRRHRPRIRRPRRRLLDPLLTSNEATAKRSRLLCGMSISIREQSLLRGSIPMEVSIYSHVLFVML